MRLNERPATKRSSTRTRWPASATPRRSTPSTAAPSPSPERHGAALPIEYAAVHPGFARIQGSGYSFFGFAALAFLIVPLVGLLLWLTTWRANRREIRAFTRG